MPAAESTIQSSTNRRLTWLISLALAALVWAVFGQTVHFEFVNYDDPGYIYKNPVITQGLNASGVMWLFSHANVGTWFPLTDLSHQLCWQLFGANAGSHHFVNVLLHMGAVIALFLTLRSLTSTVWTAAFATALFAIHPLRAESVAWVVERKDVLSGLFFMLTLRAWARHAQSPSTQAGQWWSRNYLLALMFFALGLMSKSMLVTLPFVLLLLDFWPLNRCSAKTGDFCSYIRIWLRLVIEKIPFFIMSVTIGVITLSTQNNAVVIAQSSGFFSRIGNALLAYVEYLSHIIFPIELTVTYPQPDGQPAVLKIIFAAILLLAISGLAFLQRRRHPYLIIGWLWYLGTLLPVIDIMQAGQNARADRYTYLPQIGICLLVAWGARRFVRHVRVPRQFVVFAAIVLLAAMAAAADAQTRHWQNSLTLWNRSLTCNPNNPRAENNLGSALNNLGKWDDAIPHFERAIGLQPDYVEARVNLGVAFVNQNRRSDAIQQFELALKTNPHSADAHYNLGDALGYLDRHPEAITHFRSALEVRPNYAEAHYDLGLSLGIQGNWREAIPHFENALGFNIDETDARYIVAVALNKQQKWGSAIRLLEEVLQRKPDFAEAHNNLGIALDQNGNSAEAIPHFQTALTLADQQGNAALAEILRAQLKGK